MTPSSRESKKAGPAMLNIGALNIRIMFEAEKTAHAGS